MIYVNDVLVTGIENLDNAKETLKIYLTKEKLLVVKEDNEVMSNEEIDTVLSEMHEKSIKLNAIHSSTLVREFKKELHDYILKVEEYIEKARDNEDFSMTLTSFVQVTEAILHFESVADFLQKELIDHQQIQDITSKALQQAEVGNNEYILDLMEYELMPVLQHFLNETNEVV